MSKHGISKNQVKFSKKGELLGRIVSTVSSDDNHELVNAVRELKQFINQINEISTYVYWLVIHNKFSSSDLHKLEEYNQCTNTLGHMCDQSRLRGEAKFHKKYVKKQWYMKIGDNFYPIEVLEDRSYYTFD